MRDSTLLIMAGGLATIGGYLWYRQRGGTLGATYGGVPVAYSRSAPVSGPSPLGMTTDAQDRLVTLQNAGPSFGSVAGKLGTTAGTAVGIAAIGPGSVALAGLTAGIGGAVALLSWAIMSKGLFRGGEVGVLVNPARDRFLSQFGPGGTDPQTSGFGRLAAALSEITGEPDGSHYFKALIGATTKEQLIAATQDIQGVLATIGIQIAAYES
jgi:hypothetical protein